MPIITLSTDFGTSDAYVGIMKGVILGICPSARIVDLTHEIAAQDVVAGSFLIAEAVPYFPEGTIHVGVVDPGVGSSRRAVAIAVSGAFLIGPDNGLFSRCLGDSAPDAVVELRSPRYRRPEVSSTFHGRDIFAPAAAHLAAGVAIEELGPPVERLVSVELPRPTQTTEGIAGAVIHVDRFGNLITNIGSSDVDEGAVVCIAGHRVPVVRTYAAVSDGDLLALVGSGGWLEVSVRNGSAADRLGTSRGEPMILVAG